MRFAAAMFLLVAFSLAQEPAPKSPVTEISADIGTCTAEFHITDMAGNPLYNVKIHTRIRYGAFGARKVDLDLATNADGRARITHLPSEAKNPIRFWISNDADEVMRTFDPSNDCTARYDIPLKTK